jgi:hypothetical protein
VYYKPDWAAARKRLEAFWAGEILDRCPVAVIAPRKTAVSAPACTSDPAWLANTYFGGEAVPAVSGDPDLIERCGGRYFIGSPELIGAGDMLLRLRGLDALCADLIEQPGAVHCAVDALTSEWIECQEAFYRRACEANQGAGVLAWPNLWAPGRHALLACDFSAVISPRAFRQFFLPEIERKSAWCEYCTYHLDGPRAMKAHLPALLEEEGIDVIQFAPGYAPALSPEFIPRYKEIQASGKRLYLPVEPDEIEPLLAELSPKGLFFSTHADSQAEADSLLATVAKCCATRNVFPVSWKA